MLVAALILAAGLPSSEQDAVYAAAGASRRGKLWTLCADEAQSEGVAVERYGDLNGDGRPEALLTEVGHVCYGAVGIGYALVGKQPDGSWRPLSRGSGAPELLATRGAEGYPDLSIGGPGFCHAVHRWNGRAYALQRHEYEGRPCRRGD